MNNTRKKTSPIWQVSKEELIRILNECNLIGEVLSRFDLKNHGSNYKTLVARLQYENIDYIKFKNNKYNGGKCNRPNKRPIEFYLKEKCNHSRNAIKIRLLKENLLEKKCQICKIEPLWNNKRLVLVLDHINGVSNDYRLENLRLLCPNCNSQTDTFSGKNTRKASKNKCLGCEIPLSKRNKRCKNCYDKSNDRKKSKYSTRKVIRPSKEWLEQLIWMLPYTEIGKVYEVTDNTIRKWCLHYNIDLPKKRACRLITRTPGRNLGNGSVILSLPA